MKRRPTYVLDFYCQEERLGIELDGGQHNEPERKRADRERTVFLEGKGIRVIRFWNHEVLRETEAVLEQLYYSLTPPLSLWGRGLLEKALAHGTRSNGRKPSPCGRGWPKAG